jgi:hypothetical protein
MTQDSYLENDNLDEQPWVEHFPAPEQRYLPYVSLVNRRVVANSISTSNETTPICVTELRKHQM